MARAVPHEKASMTHDQIAGAVGVDRTYVSKLIRGTRKGSIELALKIYEVAGLAVGPLKDKTPEQIAALKSANDIIQQAAA